MKVRVSKKTARRLLKENGINVELSFIKQVNPLHLQNGILLTYMRKDQSPDNKAGYHLLIP